MNRKIPRVSDGVLCADQLPGSGVSLDSLQWFAWLEAPTTNVSYAVSNCQPGYSAGFMPIRKERRTHCWVTFPAKRRSK